MSKSINYLLILVGGLVALYAQAGETQNQYLLIGGVVVLMMGLYRISRNLSSKSESSDDDQHQQNPE
ncbi:hypothetical protein [Paucihalobacter ruber]|uniref:hypothetical protein n=1 Tax=Paucihalobacter ruber TaxID=2567861 RepID=UPI001FE63EDC|nr:hypothetical protein [Paucihalobacter ruber]